MYFYAWNTNILTTVPSGAKIVFDHAVTNGGGGYNNNTGVFQAKVSGVYVFSWTVVSDRSHFVNVNLMKNGEFYGLAQADGNSGKDNGSGSNTAVLTLEEGDLVYVEVNGWGDDTNHQVWGGGHSTFSGWLIPYSSF